MVRVVRGLTGICACVFLLLFWVDVTKATGTNEVAGETCHNLYQNVNASTSILPSEYDEVEDKIKICGAAPNCSTCVDMYRGDCGYVFPTNVTVVEEKRHDGRYLCACQTFACNLAWDPAGWNKKCFTKLRCIKSKPHYDKISIEQALCGGEDGPSVRFCPLTFSKQGYFSPGLVTSVLYEGENKGKKTPYRQYEIINKFVPANVVVTASGAATNTPAQLLPSHKGSITPPGENPLHYVAYKKDDSLCLKYGGKREVNTSRAENGADFDTCIPIPVPERPVMYVKKSNGNQISHAFGATQEERDAILKDAISRNRAVFAKVNGEEYTAYIVGGAYRRKIGTQRENELLTALGESSGIQYLCMQRKSLFQEACLNTKTAVEFPKNVGYKEEKCAMEEAAEAIARFFPGYIFSRLKDIQDVPIDVAKAECRVAEKHRHNADRRMNDNFEGRSPECEYTEAPFISEFQHTMKKVRGGYDADEMIARRKTAALSFKSMARTHGMLVSSTPLFDYHAMGEVVCAKYMPQGDMEFDILAGVSTSCDPAEKLQCAEEQRSHNRFRVLKKPKTLRRYVMVGSKGERRRIRCDDKYSIDLYGLSQGVLDRSVVHGNKFVLPKEYLMSTLSDNTEDPCYSSRSEIVYFYEDGGFVAGADLRKCGNPITEYYAQGKAIRGCEYSYIRSDNYEPFLEEGNISGFSIVPLSKYEQGFCIDNFSRILFEPKLLNNGPTGQLQASHCVNRKVAASRENNGAAALATEYRFPINNDSFALPVKTDKESVSNDGPKGRKKCTFYKVEMWGGGEAAAREGDSKKGSKRSGRPGQYVSLLLDLENIHRYRAQETLCSNDERCKKAANILQALNAESEFSLLMNIGVGGQQSNSDTTATSSTRGGDTVLYLCRDKSTAEQPAAGSAGSNSDVSSSSVPSNSEATGVETGEKWPYKVINNPLFDQKNTQVSEANCYEIARAVGGGSDMLGEPWHGPHNKVLKYHRTISTNVLSSDKSGMKLLLGGEAMFTKIPVEVNMYDGNGGLSFATGGYLAQRSLPKERCNYIETPASDVSVRGPLESMKINLIVPGMGGCWGREATAQTSGVPAPTGASNSTEDKPGAGRNGAVIITCERWGNGNGRS